MKKKLLSVAAAAVICAALSGCSGESLNMGSAGQGGVYYALANEISSLANTELSGIDIYTKETAGSSANIRLVSQNYLQLALVQADLAQDMYYGNKLDPNEKTYKNYSAVTSLYTEACQIIVPADSDVYEIYDLKAKTVSIGDSESGTEHNAKEILELYGLNEKLVNEVNLNYAAAAEKFKNGSIDAMFVTAGAGAAVIKDLAAETDIRILNIDESHCDALKYSYGFYIPYEIPAGTYNGISETVYTVGVKSILIAGDTLSEATVEKITEMIYTHSDELGNAAGIMLYPDTEGITIPLHPGAEKYYERMTK